MKKLAIFLCIVVIVVVAGAVLVILRSPEAPAGQDSLIDNVGTLNPFTSIPTPAPSPAPAPKPAPRTADKCHVGGCSGQICSDQEGEISTCIYRAEYACYKKATCERQATGECGWTETPELSACLDKSRDYMLQ
jgi:hypothetical protein